MKDVWKEVAVTLTMAVLIPGLMLNTGRLLLKTDPLPPQETALDSTTAEVESNVEKMIHVQMDDGTVTFMELETYLVGVVLGEMPAEFESEALKAQAVVARTYTLRMCSNASKHPDADVCVDSACCQSYSAVTNGWEYDKIRDAVEATSGLVLTYNGELIEATYFSSSGGRTEDAVAVWGTDVPYLRSTESPEGEYADKHLETVTMTKWDFTEALGIVPQNVEERLLGAVSYTAGGGVDTMTIGNTVFRGIQLRQLLGLRSTAFYISEVGEHVIITSRGYGHRVGMSQYGAEAMAVGGATFQQILAHYYQGTTLEEFIDKDSSVG